MADIDAPPAGLDPAVAAWWRAQSAGPDHGALDRRPLADLPGPARRWLEHAITAGARRPSAAWFAQRGAIRLGRRWRRFAAAWLLTSEGFVWAARTRVGPVPVRGFDRFTDAAGSMRWRLFGRAPLIHADGADVTRSAAGRLAGELVFSPAALLAEDVRWAPLDDERAVAHVPAGQWTHPVTVTVSPHGRLRRVELPRWGNPDGAPFREHVFTAEFGAEELTADGITVPGSGRAGWWRCPDGCASEEFFRFHLLAARLR